MIVIDINSIIHAGYDENGVFHPVAYEVNEEDDNRSPATGVWYGLLFSLLCWVVLFGIGFVLWRMMR